MPPTGPIRRGFRRRFAAGPVDSRWWYWVAALPLTVALWVVTVAWLALALGVGPVTGPSPLARAAEFSMVAFGVPLLALTLVFPFAIYADASAIREAPVGWRPHRPRLLVAASPGPLAMVATLVHAAVATDGVWAPLLAVLLGSLLALPVAGGYLYRRHRRLGVP